MSLRSSGLRQAVMPRLDRGIQYAAAVVGRAGSKRECAGVLDRPVKPGDDDLFVAPSKPKKYVARMSVAKSGSERETSPGCRFAPGYGRVKPGDDGKPKTKKADPRPAVRNITGCPGGAETPPGLEDYF